MYLMNLEKNQGFLVWFLALMVLIYYITTKTALNDADTLSTTRKNKINN